MKRWLVAIIFSNLGRFFNNPQIIYRLEDRIANSAPVRQLARTIAALYHRGRWELRNLKSIDEFRHIGPPSQKQDEILRKFKQIEEELRKKMSGKV